MKYMPHAVVAAVVGCLLFTGVPAHAAGVSSDGNDQVMQPDIPQVPNKEKIRRDKARIVRKADTLSSQMPRYRDRSAQAPSLPFLTPVALPLGSFDKYDQDGPNYFLPRSQKAFEVGTDTYKIARFGTSEEVYHQKISWGSCEDFFATDNVPEPALNPNYQPPTDPDADPDEEPSEDPDPEESADPDTPDTPDEDEGVDDDVFSRMQCGYVRVPVDYSHPTGPSLAIAVSKLPATESSRGAVMLNPGGPGGAGLSMPAALAMMTPEVAKHFDLVGFDPRGIGVSLPQLRCEPSSETFSMVSYGEGADEKTLTAHAKWEAEQCYRNTAVQFQGISGDDVVDHVGTPYVVDDMDVIRAALGEEKLNYLGYSYGTRLGYVYASAHPDHVGRFVLDSVVNPFHNNREVEKRYDRYLPEKYRNTTLMNSLFTASQATFMDFARTCRDQGGFDLFSEEEMKKNAQEGIEEQNTHVACALGDKGTSDAQLLANLQTLIRPAWGGQTWRDTYFDGIPVTWSELAGLVQSSLYSRDAWPMLNMMLDSFKKGDLSIYLAIRLLSGNPIPGTGKYVPAWGNREVLAQDTERVATDVQGWRADVEELYRRAPFMDPGANSDGTLRGRAGIPDPASLFHHGAQFPKYEPLSGSHPNILYVAGTMDPATPYPYGVMAAMASNATLVTVAWPGHGMTGTVPCATQIATDFLLGTTPEGGATAGPQSASLALDSTPVTSAQCRVDSFVKDNPSATPSTSAPSQTPSQASSAPSTTDASGVAHQASQVQAKGSLASTGVWGIGFVGVAVILAAAGAVMMRRRYHAVSVKE